MCTVSVIPLGPPGAGVRIVCSRDEQRSRGAALPPTRAERQGLILLMPTDSDRGGTWIGVNSTGLVAVLLNRNPGLSPSGKSGGPSRGEIVPRVLSNSSLESALDEMRDLDGLDYAPFRLLVCDGLRAVERTGGRTGGRGAEMIDVGRELSIPFVLSSSGLGDEHVESPRRELFERMVGTNPSDLRQDLFHHHRWENRPEISVDMDRCDARTVSITTVELKPRCAEMRYEDLVLGAISSSILGYQSQDVRCRA